MKLFVLLPLILLLTACADRPVAVVSVDTFCVRVERFHASEQEAAALKRAVAVEPMTERFVRWGGAIDKQHAERCSAPVAP